VDGPAAAKPAKLAVSKAGKAGKRSIPTNIGLPESEVRFLEYRLQVVESWPESNRKRVIIQGILGRLNRPEI
jgi:hypothetical protein